MHRSETERPEPARSAARALPLALVLLWWLGCGSAQKPERPPEPAKPSAVRQAPAAEPAADLQAEGTAQPEPVAASADEVEKALAYDPADPLANLEAADALDHQARGEGGGEQTPEPGSCAVLDAGRRIWPEGGPSAIAAVGRGFVIAGYAKRDAREQLFVVHVPERGQPKPIAAFDIDPPHPRERSAPPGIAARDESDVAVAFADGKGRLFLRRLRVGGGGGAPLPLAEGVDTRFEPAVAHSPERTLVAWTEGSTPMRARLAVVSRSNAVLSRHDLTPASMGAAAPSFVSGANPPVLVAIDPRDGFSPLLRIDIGADGTPQPATVTLPVSMVATPPEIAAASSSVGTYVAYTGVGSAATSAVGLVAIEPIVGKPEAFVKGTGYGALHLAAVAAPRGVLVAADAPAKPEPQAAPPAPQIAAKQAAPERPPREIHVRLIGLSGPGPLTVLRGPSGGASHAAVARDDGGYVGVAFSSQGGTYLARLRCDDG